MRIVATSDLHGHLPEIPPCDLLLIAGDVCPLTNHEIPSQRNWLNRQFTAWIKACPAKHVAWIAGNHDLALEVGPPGRKLKAVATYLQDSAVEIEDFKIYGSPWSEIIGPWAFSLEESTEIRPSGIRRPGLDLAYGAIPADADIVVVHGAPYGVGDAVIEARGNPSSALTASWVSAHAGSPSLLRRLVEVQPFLTIFGHIHEGYGKYGYKGLPMVNASHMDEHYEPVNPPVVIDL